MKTAYIFHDAFCDPSSDWYPWMKGTLEAQGYLVVIPKFPTPAGQSYESWKAVIKNYINAFDPESIFIGHGIGGTFALRLIEELSIQIHGLFLVASYTEPLGHVGYDRVNETFTKHQFDWEKIKNGTLTIKVFAGQNDPFVPQTLTDNLAQSLDTTAIIIPEGGHLNSASGFTQIVPLAQGIKEGMGEINKTIVVEPTTEEVVQEIIQPAKQAEKPSLIKPEAVKPILGHTMYQDMTTLVNSNKGQVASSLLGKARTEEAEKKAKLPTSPANALYIAGTLAVVLVILGVGAVLASKILPAQKNTPVPTVPSLIQAEFHQNINIAGKQSYEVEQAIKTSLVQSPKSGTINDIYYTRGTLRASFPDVLESLDLADDMPASLTGEFIPAGITDTPVFMHASASIGGTPAHALILPVAHYDKTFAGMKEWEQTLFRDMGVFMNVPTSFLKTKLTRDTFHDEMVSNKNIRVLRYKKPVDITLDEPAAVPKTETSQPFIANNTNTSSTSSEETATAPVPNFISDGLATAQQAFQNPQVVSPYQENDFMIGYFFLNDHTVIIVDNLSIIPELLTRYANSQIYQ